jgi:hypothetical protein
MPLLPTVVSFAKIVCDATGRMAVIVLSVQHGKSRSVPSKVMPVMLFGAAVL